MDILFKTRCTGGHLIVYPNKVAIELHSFGVDKVNSINLKEITGVELKTVSAGILGIGGIATLTIHSTGNQKLEAKMVKLKEAKQAEEIINNLISNKAETSSDSPDQRS